MADNDGKTEDPTPKKLREAHKEGQVPRTPDLATWFAIAAAAATLPMSCSLLSESFTRLLRGRLAEIVADPTPVQALGVLTELPRAVLVPLAPVGLAAMAGALIGTAGQGVYLTGKTLKPKMSRMSPKQGFQRMFGKRALWEAVKALIKVITIGIVVYVLSRSMIPSLVGAGLMPISTVLNHTWDGIETLLWATALTGVVLAGADYAFQRRTVMKQLRMTPREIKDEMRQTEGDPLIKSAIRARQMAMSRNRMLQSVSTADVVVVNPTHLAVALKYERGRGAPRVVAKGSGSLAAKIRERAREHRVPVVEDRSLARTLYRVCDLDDEIPAELYLAVARVLAFIMAAGRPSATAGARRPMSSTPVPDLPKKSVLRARRAQEERKSRRASHK
ncbi:MAG: EscU/YscU/HrcU family type secretion system export apparatus switch protein [Actinomycetota bacterium]|nr:EscU/YscU/HrcU family type secretion system export apparatus switch protein [Actinomycetota bacterium]